MTWLGTRFSVIVGGVRLRVASSSRTCPREKAARAAANPGGMPSDDAALIAFIRANRDRYVEELTAWIACPSISGNPAHAADVRASAETAAARMRAAGLTGTEVLETGGHPVAYGEWLGAPGAPTMLIYGHHDVQPADPLELWTTPPFEAAVRDGKIYGRGTVDDKGQVLMHVAAIEAHLRVRGRCRST